MWATAQPFCKGVESLVSPLVFTTVGSSQWSPEFCPMPSGTQTSAHLTAPSPLKLRCSVQLLQPPSTPSPRPMDLTRVQPEWVPPPTGLCATSILCGPPSPSRSSDCQEVKGSKCPSGEAFVVPLLVLPGELPGDNLLEKQLQGKTPQTFRHHNLSQGQAWEAQVLWSQGVPVPF